MLMPAVLSTWDWSSLGTFRNTLYYIFGAIILLLSAGATLGTFFIDVRSVEQDFLTPALSKGVEKSC